MRPTDSVFQFGAFSLHPAGRLLLENGEPIAIGARALDILILLVQHAGEFVPKDELFRSVWPDTIVEETSLRVHIAALRKAFGSSGARFIENAPGKGYKFAAEVACTQVTTAANLSKVARGSRQEMPVRLTRMIGRTGAVETISSLLLTKRFVTITGEGGVGKTTLSLAVADTARDEYADGTVFVDLAVLTHPAQLVSAFGRALGLTIPMNAPARSLGEAIKNQALLLVVDNCEHLVRDAATLVAELLGLCPSLRVLATSREALRAGGEQVHRLESLPCPPTESRLTAAEALRYESIQLLVERVSAAVDGFELSDAEAEHAAELCRRLDGVPLAIELAAARVGFFGLHGLLMRLPDRLRILNAGHRTVMPRHQTLRSLYDWSYDLLDEDARLAFARLSVFPGFFSLDAALRMMPWSDRAKAVTIFLDLVNKSLVAAELGTDTRRYRLLDTARVYASEKLAASGSVDECRLVHADSLVRTLEAANRAWVRETHKVWLDRYAPLSDDITAALRWLSNEPQHALLFAHLTVASYQLAQQLSQLESHRHFVALALKHLELLPNPPKDLRIQLLTLFGFWLIGGCPGQADIDDWMEKAVKLVDDEAPNPALLMIVSVANLAYGDYRRMLKGAERLEVEYDAAGDGQGRVVARRLQAQAHHFLGHLVVSKRLATEVLAFPGGSTLRLGRVLDAMDRRLSMGIVLARTHWLEGRSAEAEMAAKSCIELAGQEVDHAKCQALALAAIPIAIWCGDMELASSRLDEFRFLNARQTSVDYWTEWVLAFEGLVAIGTVFQPIRCAKLLDLVGALSPAFHDERLVRRAESGAAGWCAPEVIRAYGQRLLAASGDNADVARGKFLQAVHLARGSGALRWELKAAISLAELELSDHNVGDAERLLMVPLSKFPQLETDADVSRAVGLIERLKERRRPVAQVAA